MIVSDSEAKKYIGEAGIYGFNLKGTGRWYVGQASEIYRRYKSYFQYFKNPAHNMRIIKAMREHGMDAFDFHVLEVCEIEELTQREIFFCEKLNALSCDGFNVRYPLDRRRGMIVSESTRERMRKARKGRTVSPEARHKARIALLGKPMPLLQRMRISEALKGRKIPRESVEKQAATTRGRKRKPFTQIHKDRMGAAFSVAVLQIDKKTGEIIAEHSSTKAASISVGGHQSSICDAMNGKLKTSKGFRWVRKYPKKTCNETDAIVKVVCD